MCLQLTPKNVETQRWIAKTVWQRIPVVGSAGSDAPVYILLRGSGAPLNVHHPNIKLTLRPKTYISKPFSVCQNALKLTYSNPEFQFFPAEDPRTSRFPERGKGEGRNRGLGEDGSGRWKGREGRGGREGGREALPQTKIYHYTTGGSLISRSSYTKNCSNVSK